MIRKFDSSGAVVCWDSQRVLRQNAESAFGSVGKPQLVPAVNHLAALTDAAKTVANEAGLSVPGVFEYWILGNERAAAKSALALRRSIAVGNRIPPVSNVPLTRRARFPRIF